MDAFYNAATPTFHFGAEVLENKSGQEKNRATQMGGPNVHTYKGAQCHRALSKPSQPLRVDCSIQPRFRRRGPCHG
ncbi:MAG: hypothetical protein DWI18_00990, partial [Planctomycetota bacterium]